MTDGRILFFYRSVGYPPDPGTVIRGGETLFRVHETFDEDGTTELILHPCEVR